MALFAFVLLGSLWIGTSMSENLYIISIQSGKNTVINKQGGFYDSDIIIRNVVPKRFSKNISVYYTIDAVEPTNNSDLLDIPIYIQATDKEQIVTLKYLVCHNNEPIFRFNEIYVSGKNIYNRYHTKIVNLTINDEELFNKKDGLFVKGQTYETYVAQGGDPSSTQAFTLCNYYQRGEAWRRSAQINIWNKSGESLVKDNITVEIDGNGSRSGVVKSLKLNLDDGSDLQQYFGKKYNKALLKSGGQEFTTTSIRWDVIQDLQAQAGITTAVPHELVVVYINGQYYAVMSLSLEYSSKNISLMCDIPDNNIEKLSSGCWLIFRTLVDLNEFEQWDIDKKRNWIEENIDIQNMFQYYAVEILTNNVDWPDANYKIWRYIGSSPQKNKYLDGKWRFIMFDTDLVYLLPEDERTNIFGKETIEKVFNNDSFDILNELLKDNNYKMIFVNYLCSLSKTVFSEDNVIDTINKYDSIMNSELPFYEESIYNKADEYTKDWVENYKKNRAKNVSDMKEAVSSRHEDILNALQQNLLLHETYNLKIYSNTSYLIGNDFMMISPENKNYNAKYFSDYPIEIHTLSGIPAKFIINNEKIVYDNQITVDSNLINNDAVIIEIK